MRSSRSAAAALLLACGCGGLAAVNKRSPADIAKGVFTPTLPPAAVYGPDPTRQCPQFGVNGEDASQLKDQMKGKAEPQAEGRLCQAAETLLSWDPAEAPSEYVLSFPSWYFGL